MLLFSISFAICPPSHCSFRCADCTDCDFRLAYIPSRDHEHNSKRPVYAARFAYPRYGTISFCRFPAFSISIARLVFVFTSQLATSAARCSRASTLTDRFSIGAKANPSASSRRCRTPSHTSTEATRSSTKNRCDLFASFSRLFVFCVISKWFDVV